MKNHLLDDDLTVALLEVKRVPFCFSCTSD